MAHLHPHGMLDEARLAIEDVRFGLAAVHVSAVPVRHPGAQCCRRHWLLAALDRVVTRGL